MTTPQTIPPTSPTTMAATDLVVTTTQDNVSSGSDEEPSSNYLIVFLNLFFGFLILGGNSLTLAAIYRTRRLQTQPNFYIASLAAADIIVGVTLLIRILMYIESTVHLLASRKYVCLCYLSLLYTSMAASIFSLLLVSIDRVINLSYSLLYEVMMTPKRTGQVILGVWISAIIYGTVPIYTSPPFDPEAMCDPTKVVNPIYMFYVHPISFLIGSISIMACYVQIARVFLRHRTAIQSTQPAALAPNSANPHRPFTGQQQLTTTQCEAIKTNGVVNDDKEVTDVRVFMNGRHDSSSQDTSNVSHNGRHDSSIQDTSNVSHNGRHDSSIQDTSNVSHNGRHDSSSQDTSNISHNGRHDCNSQDSSNVSHKQEPSQMHEVLVGQVQPVFENQTSGGGEDMCGIQDHRNQFSCMTNIDLDVQHFVNGILPSAPTTSTSILGGVEEPGRKALSYTGQHTASGACVNSQYDNLAFEGEEMPHKDLVTQTAPPHTDNNSDLRYERVTCDRHPAEVTLQAEQVDTTSVLWHVSPAPGPASLDEHFDLASLRNDLNGGDTKEDSGRQSMASMTSQYKYCTCTSQKQDNNFCNGGQEQILQAVPILSAIRQQEVACLTHRNTHSLTDNDMESYNQQQQEHQQMQTRQQLCPANEFISTSSSQLQCTDPSMKHSTSSTSYFHHPDSGIDQIQLHPQYQRQSQEDQQQQQQPQRQQQQQPHRPVLSTSAQQGVGTGVRTSTHGVAPSKMRMVKVLLLVCGVFFLCWSPVTIILVLVYTCGVSFAAVSVSTSLALANSAVNFFIYAASNRDFRDAFKKILCTWSSS